MKPVSFRITDDLYLVRHPVPTAAPAAPVELPTNHIVVIDCSGSMSGDLPQIRAQLKAKLPRLLGEADTISIVWFSGRGQFGILVEGEAVATLADLKDLHNRIDRWLKPIGMTGFREPLGVAGELAKRLVKKTPGSVCSLFFMSDGCDNQWGRAEILKAVEEAAAGVAAATIVEYGYYADRAMLSKMAEVCGGAHIFADSFARYEPVFEAAMQKRPTGGKKVELRIGADAVGGFVYALGDEATLLTFGVQGDTVLVPEGTEEVWFLSPTLVGTKLAVAETSLRNISNKKRGGEQPDPSWPAAAYAAISLFAVRMKPEVVYPLLKATGDVAFIESFSTCFGKQRYSTFQEEALRAAFNPSLRCVRGWDPDRVPPDDAFTVLDLLEILADDDGNKVLLNHPSFVYNRIGRKQLDASENLTATELKEIETLTDELKGLRDPKRIGEINQRIGEITGAKKEGLKFTESANPDEGYSISDLTFSEERANVSIKVKKEGTVNLAGRLPFAGKVPEQFPTHIFRNYAIVKDGLVNVEKLPVKLTDATINRLKGRCPLDTLQPIKENVHGRQMTFDLTQLPVINRKMVQRVSARRLFEMEFEALRIAGAQKVYGDYKKRLFPELRTAGLAEKYGEEAAKWLAEQGITDGGFNPKSTAAESTDVYMGKELKVSLKGFSTLPPVKDVLAKVGAAGASAHAGKAKPISGAAGLMAPYVRDVERLVAQHGEKSPELKRLLDEGLAAAKKRRRELLFQIAQVKFSVIVGQVWFTEFATLDENTLTVPLEGDVVCKAELREVQIAI